MNKILMVDYYGASSLDGKAVGHSPKVAKEYRCLFPEEVQVDAALSPCIAGEVSDAGFQNIHILRYNIVEADYQKLFKRILDKIKILSNIHQAFQLKGYDIIWFYRVDFFLFFYCIFRLKKKRPIKVCLVYHLDFNHGIMGKIFNVVYRKGIKKFDGVIFSQKNMKIPHENTFYMPDYYYDKNEYIKYHKMLKGDRVVCLGAMNPYKKLEELIESFNISGYPLEIVGYFFDKDRFEKIKSMSKDNIIVSDRILSKDDYYTKLATAKFTILPYDMKQYHNRTSGILIESIFLNVIPIAPNELLEVNQVCGIGYQDLKEVTVNILEKKYDDILLQNYRKVKNEHNSNRVKSEFIKWFFKMH